MGVLFLLAPAWTFPFIDEITLSIVRQRLRPENFTILGFDAMRFPMEFGTSHYLYVIGVWITFVALILKSLLKLQDEMKKRRP